MGSDKKFGLQRMWGSWVDIASMQEPDTPAIAMVTGALISLYNQVDALLEESKLKDLVAWKFQADVRSFPLLIADVLPALNSGNRRFDRNFFRVVQLMCKVLEEARDALDDYLLASLSILHARTIIRRLETARNKTKHVVSLFHTYCDTRDLNLGTRDLPRSSSASQRDLLLSSSVSQRGLSRSSTTISAPQLTSDRELNEPLRKVKTALLQLEVTASSSASKPCPKRILKMVAKMRSDSSTNQPLAIFTLDDLDHFCRVGGVEALLRLLNSPSQPTQTHARVNLESLMTTDKTRLKICVAPGVLEQLATMVASTYGEVQHGALEVLRCLLRSNDQIDCSRIFFPGIIERLLELLDSSSPKVQGNASGVLRELSRDPATYMKIAAAPHAVEKLVRLFSSPSPTIQFCAAATLCGISVKERARTFAMNLPHIPNCLRVLLEVHEPWDLPVSSGRQLQRELTVPQVLFKEEDFQVITPGVAGWWVAMLDSKLEIYQSRALEMLTKLQEKLMEIAVQEGVLARLVKLLYSPSLGIQERAAKALGNFSLPKVYELKVAKQNGAIQRLVELLDSESFSVRENACEVLESLSFSKRNRRKVAEAEGAIRKLSMLLFADSFPVQANAASVLWNLSNTNSLNKVEVARVGITLERLVELLDSTSSLVQEKAAGALMNLSRNSGNRSEISAIPPADSAITRFVGLLESRSTLVHQNAAGALYNLSTDKETAKRIATIPMAVPSLVNLLGSASRIVQEYAAGAIANLSASEETRELCRQNRALRMLRKLKTSPSVAVRTEAKRALGLYGYS